MQNNKKERAVRELLEAAKNIIHNEGHESVTVRRIAQLTGYTYPILYHYFKDLNSLLWTLRLEMIEDMISFLQYLPDGDISPIEEIKQIFKMYTAYFFDHPNVFRFFYFYAFKQPAEDEDYDQLELRFQTMWQGTFARLLEDGIVDAADIEMTAKTIIYSIQGMIMLSLSANGSLGRTEVELELDKLIAFLFQSKNSIL